MGKFGASSSKRHVAWSNDEEFIATLIKEGGYMSREEKDMITKAKLAHTWVDPSSGKKKFQGVKKTLKASQTLVCVLSHCVMFEWC